VMSTSELYVLVRSSNDLSQYRHHLGGSRWILVVHGFIEFKNEMQRNVAGWALDPPPNTHTLTHWAGLRLAATATQALPRYKCSVVR
jgi:hypothetical protein